MVTVAKPSPRAPLRPSDSRIGWAHLTSRASMATINSVNAMMSRPTIFRNFDGCLRSDHANWGLWGPIALTVSETIGIVPFAYHLHTCVNLDTLGFLMTIAGFILFPAEGQVTIVALIHGAEDTTALTHAVDILTDGFLDQEESWDRSFRHNAAIGVPETDPASRDRILSMSWRPVLMGAEVPAPVWGRMVFRASAPGRDVNRLDRGSNRMFARRLLGSILMPLPVQKSSAFSRTVSPVPVIARWTHRLHHTEPFAARMSYNLVKVALIATTGRQRRLGRRPRQPDPTRTEFQFAPHRISYPVMDALGLVCTTAAALTPISAIAAVRRCTRFIDDAAAAHRGAAAWNTEPSPKAWSSHPSVRLSAQMTKRGVKGESAELKNQSWDFSPSGNQYSNNAFLPRVVSAPKNSTG
ncbi:MAG: hypothetical protein C7B45_05260 [Sulfobacillus acidophilus]|uniref:Uncharacterized protein n=1 Tax=Sulfobacillus acidophilus TaxID=53633 RepID=A0A2T2WKY8_9FIRM|nr:MAG: hypothetical protein C7B45_05260 [Sulfobacillus acidophilus]